MCIYTIRDTDEFFLEDLLLENIINLFYNIIYSLVDDYVQMWATCDRSYSVWYSRVLIKVTTERRNILDYNRLSLLRKKQKLSTICKTFAR